MKGVVGRLWPPSLRPPIVGATLSWRHKSISPDFANQESHTQPCTFDDLSSSVDDELVRVLHIECEMHQQSEDLNRVLIEEKSSAEQLGPGKAGEANISVHEGLSSEDDATPPLSRLVLTLMTLYGLSASNAIGTGLVTVALPRIASDLELDDGLILCSVNELCHPWLEIANFYFRPGVATALASGSCFLLSGAVADLVGNRSVGLYGCLVIIAALVGSGVSKSGTQFIVMRALHGIGASMYLPTTTSLWTSTVGPGRSRVVGFAIMSFASPVGLQTGYFLAGALEPTSLSWRFAFYLAAGIIFVFGAIGYIVIPAKPRSERMTWRALINELDFVGILLSSGALGLLSYFFAEISDSAGKIHTPRVPACLATSVVLFVLFFLWMNFRSRRGLRPLIANSLWCNRSFAAMCILMTVACGTSNSIEWFFSLYFQQVQDVSALETALRFLPNVLIGVVTGFVMGYLLDSLPVNLFVSASALISTAAPLIMALIDPKLSWWIGIFWALLTSPTAQDVMYTVSSVIITERMPQNQHSLAGGVLNTLGYVGTSVTMAVMSIVSNSKIDSLGESDAVSPLQYLSGYRAAFWTNFGMMATMIVVGLFLRREKPLQSGS